MDKIILLQILSGAVVVGWINFIVGYFVGTMFEKERKEENKEEKQK